MRAAGLFMLLVSLSPLVVGQDMLRVKSYGVDQGLPQSTIWDILQDKSGFIWISTSDGLTRFDGYEFFTYRNDPYDSFSISSVSSHDLLLDRHGDIIISHDEGLQKYDQFTGKFHSLVKYSKKAIGYNRIAGEDRRGFLWIWIQESGLTRINLDSLANVSHYSTGNKQLDATYARDAIIDSDGIIWLTMPGTSLVSFNPVSNTFQFIPTGFTMNALHDVSDSILLAGTPTGLLRINKKTKAIQNLAYHPTDPAYSTYLTAKILQTDNHTYLIGTDKGLFEYDDSAQRFIHHYTDILGGPENFLFVQAICKDRSGIIWLGTNGDGLKKYSPKSIPWKHFKSGSERGDIVKSIYANDQEVFVGYFDNGMDIFNRSEKLIRKIRKGPGPNNLPGDWPYCIQGIDSDRLFIGFGQDVSEFGVYNMKNRTMATITSEVLRVAGEENRVNNPFPIAVPYQGGLLFNCKSALIHGRWPGNGKSEFSLLKTFKNEIITTVSVDQRGTIRVGTFSCYYYLLAGSKTWIKGNVASRRHVKSIATDTEGNTWVGTISGLFVVNAADSIIQWYRTGAPLVNDFVYGLLVDNRGDIWFSHNRGLTRYDHTDHTFRNFTVEDGLQSNEFNTGAYFKTPGGELFFGGINGTNSFYPEDITYNLQTPTVQITKIDVHERPLVHDTSYWQLRHLRLSHTNNTLAFEFAGLEYTEPAKNQYAWRMSGIDSGWVMAGDKRFTRYANLPPGSYTFQLKASNNDGVWSTTPTSLVIEIIPPFWQTGWFRGLAGIVVISCVAGAAYSVSRIRYKRKWQEEELKQRIKLDQMKLVQDERSRISRDLHDNVGALVSFVSTKIDWVLHHKQVEQEAVPDLEMVKDNAREIMSGLRETIWTLHNNTITNEDLADRLKVYLKSHLLMPCDIHDLISRETVISNEAVLGIYRSCQEIANNINRHSQATQVTVTFENTGSKGIRITFADDGIGMTAPQQNQEGHYGIENLRLRLQEIGGCLEIHSTPGKGTQVMITYD